MSQNISEILFGIKENIKKIESGQYDDGTLNDVRSDFLDMLELIKLLLISERDTYYGYFMMNMQFEADFYSSSIAGIKLDTYPPVFSSNPLLLCKMTLKEIIYVVCHEIDHVMFNHPIEMIKANPKKDPDTFYEFNLAADAAVNDRINYEIVSQNFNFMRSPEGLITSNVLKEMFSLKSIRSLENYAYYFRLIKGKSKNEQDTFPAVESGGQNSGAGDSVVTANNVGELEDHNWGLGDEVEDAQNIVREFVNSAYNMMNDEARGLMPAVFIEQVRVLNIAPILPWQSILKKYVGTISSNRVSSRRRLNRRQPERFDLSGSVEDKILKIVVAIDTSGSVSNEMLAEIFNEIFAIVAKRKHEITVIECDAEVQRVYKAKRRSDIKTKATGRGGTAFTPVIEYINNDRYFRDALLIYFTDGFGESEVPRPRTYRNMWVVFHDKENLSVKEPYGVVLAL